MLGISFVDLFDDRPPEGFALNASTISSNIQRSLVLIANVRFAAAAGCRRGGGAFSGGAVYTREAFQLRGRNETTTGDADEF